MNRNKSFTKIAFRIMVVYTTIIGYILYLLFVTRFNTSSDYSSLIFWLSWMGIILGVYIIITWYKLTGTIFSLYTIFMLFFFLFNYGQCLMWAFGIHQPGEIGQTALYTLGIPTSADIVYTQALTLISILAFHCGAIFCYKPSKVGKKDSKIDDITSISIYYTCLFASLIVVPVTFYHTFYKLIVSHKYGYRAFYYSDIVSNIVVFNLIRHMFFPCLVGLLIGSKYSKKVRISVYAIFTIYLLVNALSGDRGSWLFKLIILIWMDHKFYKPINWKKTIKYCLLSIIGLHLVDAIVSVRNLGINIENIINSITLEESVIISAIFEMGASMRPAIVLVKYGWDIWPYGNTYINALLGIISSRIFSIIGRPFEPISDWFSQKYLGISYGAGFSIVAESLLNFGPIVAPISMILLGYLIGSLIYLDKNVAIEKCPLRIFFTISTMSMFIHVIRNHFQWVLKSWFYGVIILMIVILIVRSYLNKKNFIHRDNCNRERNNTKNIENE